MSYVCNMYYRRKILLSIIEESGGVINRLSLHKILFLLSRHQSNPSFDFIPYKYGCYSFQANADLNTMIKYDQIKEEDNGYRKVEGDTYINSLKELDKRHIKHIVSKYRGLPSKKLIKDTYEGYPYYAINSLILDDVLDKDQIEKVRKQKPVKEEKKLFTIGYEGISIEKYLNKLIINDIRLLCDVRKNPLSRKTGFSKKSLKYFCEALNISYIHLPEWGIKSEFRKDLKTQSDYNKLFEQYEKEVIEENKDSLNKFTDLINSNDRIALTCFEASHCQCHRGRITKYLRKMKGWETEIKHL